ncbi:probable RNA-binding protein CG14230 [Chrysoperla carnea]|uniref:probable RNA-binding protein CG14230 n=1 Tax=Chrysoperla carnea TaxID=189513 RepID=UPI001D064417|nr:probable RNA-binding protein CG14230 [Chrysoperla carnea]
MAPLQKLHSEEKRLQSLAEKKQSYKQQKNAIQQALQQIETGSNRKNRIVFNENDSESKPKKKQKLSLFDQDADNDGDEINFKEQFDGTKGQKVELQSRFAHDSRFTMDSRFIEEDEQENEKTEIQSEENLETEKKKQLDILATITGKKISEHSQKQVKKDQPEENVTSEVQQKTFYKVSSNLKDSLKENNSFSLLNMFGDSPETHGNNEVEEETTSKDIKKKKHIGPVSNPFKYDSSDSEDETEVKKNSKPLTLNDTHGKKEKKINTEKFFFTADDSRLKGIIISQDGYFK